VINELKFDEKGLIPAVIQDEKSGRVMTLCYMNREALERTIETGLVHVFRRSAGELQMKGATSGNTQAVRSISADCEGKSLLIRIDPAGPGCHKNYFSCYFRERDPITGRLIVRDDPIPGGDPKSPPE